MAVIICIFVTTSFFDLRSMAMSEPPFVVNCGQDQFSMAANDVLLETALGRGIAIPNSCRSGLCQSCLVKVTDGDIPEKAQKGLSPNQKFQNFALACQLQANSNLTIDLSDGAAKHPAQVIEHCMLNQHILRLRLKADIPWFPGQYLMLWKDEQCGRPYSIASLPEEGFLEFHIRIYRDGELSAWLQREVKAGTTINIGDAIGSCFYTDGMATKPMLLVGYGTGLSPLYGIVKDALRKGHTQPIRLYVTGRRPESFYYQRELKSLSDAHDMFKVEEIVVDRDTPSDTYAAIKKEVLTKHSTLQNWYVFLCGAPALVKSLQKSCFLQGASMKDIHADSFISGR